VCASFFFFSCSNNFLYFFLSSKQKSPNGVKPDGQLWRLQFQSEGNVSNLWKRNKHATSYFLNGIGKSINAFCTKNDVRISTGYISVRIWLTWLFIGVFSIEIFWFKTFEFRRTVYWFFFTYLHQVGISILSLAIICQNSEGSFQLSNLAFEEQTFEKDADFNRVPNF
jgi:hypothetical protein